MRKIRVSRSIYSGNLTRVLCTAILFYTGTSSLWAQSTSGVFRCKDQRHIVNLSINNSGQVVEGPVCAQIVINVLRYGADFGKTISYTAGANLGSTFPSSFSAGGAAPREEAESLDQRFNTDSQNIRILQGQLPLVVDTNRKTGANTDNYLTSLRTLIAQTDDVLRTGGARAVIKLVTDPEKQKQMDAVIANAFVWKTTDEIVNKLLKLQVDLNALPVEFPDNTGTITGDPCSDDNRKHLGWADWSKCRDPQFKAAQSMAAAALSEANQWTSDGDKAIQFAKKIGIVQYWKNTIVGLTEDSFTLQSEVPCGVLFNKNEQTVLKLVLVDRTSVFDGQPGQSQTKDSLLTVMCSSPFSVTAGAAFSTIQNREFAIVKSAPTSGQTSINTFGVVSDSRVNPYPIAIAHARLREWAGNRYALHYSFGVGASIKGGSSGGSNPEFLTGLSISFLRTIFVTGGLDVGKQSKLIGAFKIGDIVPTDITSPPVSSSYTAGFGFAISFTKP